MRDCSQLKLIFLQLQMSMNHSKMQVDHCATICYIFANDYDLTLSCKM